MSPCPFDLGHFGEVEAADHEGLVPVALWAVVALSFVAALVHALSGRTGEALMSAFTAGVYGIYVRPQQSTAPAVDA